MRFWKLKLKWATATVTTPWHDIPWDPDWLIGILAYEVIPEYNWVELHPQKIQQNQQITKGPFLVTAQVVYFSSRSSFLSESTQAKTKVTVIHFKGVFFPWGCKTWLQTIPGFSTIILASSEKQSLTPEV